MRRLTTEDFIKLAVSVHGNKYDYSKSEYKTKKEPVIIICHEKDENGVEHGEFEQTPDAHTRGQGCPKCKFLKLSLRLKKDINTFVTLANKIHNNKYNYDKFEYVSSHIEGIITCPIHGDFKQSPANHLAGKGCPECGRIKISEARLKDPKEFIEHCLKLNPEYDYSITEYKGMELSIKYICPIHGIVELNAADHYHNGAGCPKCNKSHGEKYIEQCLKEHNIEYIDQYPIDIDKNINVTGKAKIDFYLPKYNAFIEYNGIQHYVPVEHFGGKLKLLLLLLRDLEVIQYCKNNNLLLITIPYTIKTFDQINEFLLDCIDAIETGHFLNLVYVPVSLFYELLKHYK